MWLRLKVGAQQTVLEELGKRVPDRMCREWHKK